MGQKYAMFYLPNHKQKMKYICNMQLLINSEHKRFPYELELLEDIDKFMFEYLSRYYSELLHLGAEIILLDLDSNKLYYKVGIICDEGSSDSGKLQAFTDFLDLDFYHYFCKKYKEFFLEPFKGWYLISERKPILDETRD